MMQPPGSIEQLNNFRDSIQSPDGLDRLRAMQYIQASSQGLSGMPQVTAPPQQMQPQVPMMNRAYGGEIGTGGLVRVAEDGTQIFDNSQEGALNRATHGGVLEGYNYTPSTGDTATATSTPVTTNSLDAPGTLASGVDYSSSSGVPGIASGALADLPSVQQRQGIYNASEFKDIGMSLDRPSDAPETMLIPNQAQSTVRDSRGKIPYDLYVPQPIQTYGQGYDLSGLDYITANQLSLNEGADRFMYGDKFARTDPGLLSNYDYYQDGPKFFKPLEDTQKIQEMTSGMYDKSVLRPQNPNSPQALRAQGYEMGYNGQMIYTGKMPNRIDPMTSQPYLAQGGQVISRAEGGQVDPAQAAQGLASFGRNGDSMLLHIQPEELDGLASLGQITYNPVTGLPEAFGFKSFFKAVRKLAPIALAIAAPYAFGATTALGIGAATAGGSFFGNLIAGAKPGDALKAGLMSGLFAGGGAYLGGASSGFGSAGSSAGQGAAGYGSAAMGSSAGVNSAGQAMYGSTAGSSALKAGLGAPSSMGATGFGQGMAGGGGSEFSGIASYGNIPKATVNTAVRPQLKLAPTPVAQGTTVYGMPENPNMAQIGQGQAGEQVSQFNSSPTPEGPVANTINPNVGPNLQGPPTAPYQSPTADLRIQSRAQLEGTPTNPSLFQDSSMDNFKRIGQNIYDDYGTKEGLAKIVGMDLATPDYEAQYAAEAAAKNQQLTDAGFTVETGFDGQTVIRDSTGVVMPRNLTVQDILNRSLGKSPRTNLVARTDYRTSTPEERAAMQAGRGTGLAQGGLIGLKNGGEFSGMVPGDGHGMEDNVYMPIVEKGQGSQVGTLAVSPSEYVVDSYTMAALGNGNADAGAKVMDNVVKRVRKKAYGDTKQPNEISGLSALEPMIERV